MREKHVMRWETCVLSMGLVCALAVSGWAADFSDLPIGYLEITEYEDGQLNVLARCVPAERLLADLAKRSGVALEFPTPVSACVSLPIQPDRDLVRPAHWWFVQVLTACGLTRHVPPGAETGQVRPEHPDRYNPMLPETEVIAKYKRPAVTPATAPGEGITGAVLILRGKFVPPPYRVEVGAPYRLEVDGDSAILADVLVNGVLWTQVEELPTPGEGTPEPKMPASGQFEDVLTLRDYVWLVLYPKHLKTSGPKIAHQRVVEFLESQQLIEKIVDPEELLIIYAHDPHRLPNALVPADYELSTGRFVDDGMAINRGKTAAELGDEEADELRHLLALDRVVVRGTHGRGGASGIGGVCQFRSCLAEAYTLPLAQRECALREILRNRCVARELAVNLPSDYQELTKALDALVAELEQRQLEKELDG